MLNLKKITKVYHVADTEVEALRGIDLVFRKNEFVSILGPSGCGKTTLLNIIGGLDQYTSGDLAINGRSTKEFKDKDWDVYRNHRIGFVFQSYNLIPHQTILGNVELALTIAGISKEERIERAKKAIDRVGLAGQYHKRPNQLSGGQCQRVAIARALVNEPEILLADEPTGALDTQTSIQIMELIKDISKEKLVIMVTHNPDLAEKYSTRIVRLLDGTVVSDSNPFSEKAEEQERLSEEKIFVQAKKERAKMSLWTAFKLSARNLWTKRARTIMTCLAGSIGIIGVSLVLAVSAGVKGYIASMQDDMLSGNPITIEESTYDLNAFLGNLSTNEKLEIIKDHVNVNSLLEYFSKNLTGDQSFIVKNTITEDYINYLKAMPKEYYSAIAYYYGINLSNNIYTDFTSSQELFHPSLTVIKSIYTKVLENQDGFAEYSNLILSLSQPISQVLSDEDYILSQYDMKAGHFPTKENELLLVLNKDQSVTDLTLAQLGYYTQDEFIALAVNLNDPNNKKRFTYEELMNKSFYYYPNDAIYENGLSTATNLYPIRYKSDQKDIAQSGEELKVVGIIMPKEDISYGALQSGFYYTEALVERFLNDAKTSSILASAKEAIRYLNQMTGNQGKVTEDNFRFGITTDSGISMMKITYDFTWYNYGSTTPNIKKDEELTSVSASSGMLSMMMPSSNVSANGPSIREIGGNSLPNSVEIYPLDFDRKFLVTDYLDAWNEDETIQVGDNVLAKEDRYEVKYSDNLELIITMVNGMIDIVTVALICFTALSLVVSCVMIAIITYVSVMERVKEIGVIRSLGGRKKDVSHLFNAETFMIGLCSGVFGIAVTYLVSLILNIVVHQFTGVDSICALPWWQAFIMILVSVALTAVSGLIPAKSAAKKDPVVALRTE